MLSGIERRNSSTRAQIGTGVILHFKLLGEAKDQLVAATMTLGTKGMAGDITYPLQYATPYLFMFGHVFSSNGPSQVD